LAGIIADHRSGNNNSFILSPVLFAMRGRRWERVSADGLLTRSGIFRMKQF
jgi:hypothetical protein